MSRHPEVKWAQRVNNVYITILLPDAKNVNVNLEPEGALTFSATAGAEDHLYELKLELYDKVDVEESKINIGARNIFCVIEKVDKVWWKKLLRGDGKSPHYLKVDWDKWVDEDEDSGTGDLDFGNMDFSKFGGMEGMGDDMGDLDDSDDEDVQEAGKAEDVQEAGKAEVAGSAKDAENTGEVSAEEKIDSAPSS